MHTLLLLALLVVVIAAYVVGVLCVLVSLIPVFVGAPLVISHLLGSRGERRSAEGLWEIPAICVVLLVVGVVTCYGCHHAVRAIWPLL